MSTADEILDLIDVGLQTAGEGHDGYGTDDAPSLCARCQVGQLDDGHDICAPCRAFLADDDTTDPVSPRVSPGATSVSLGLDATRGALGYHSRFLHREIGAMRGERYASKLDALCRDEDRAAQIRAQLDTTYSTEHLFKAITWGYSVDHTCALLAYAALLPWYETEILFRMVTPVVYARSVANQSAVAGADRNVMTLTARHPTATMPKETR